MCIRDRGADRGRGVVAFEQKADFTMIRQGGEQILFAALHPKHIVIAFADLGAQILQAAHAGIDFDRTMRLQNLAHGVQPGIKSGVPGHQNGNLFAGGFGRPLGKVGRRTQFPILAPRSERTRRPPGGIGLLSLGDGLLGPAGQQTGLAGACADDGEWISL